tara:strand:+ start:3887 stop:4297 length:411 start_codon:yes stop_codon:yes gene_type:complete
MSNFHYTPGLHNAGSYVSSGYPYLKTYTLSNSGVTEQQLSFNHVTKQVVITNSETTSNRDLRVHLLSTGSQSGAQIVSNKHYYDVPNNTSLTLDLKCKEIFFSNASGGSITFSVFASQTQIPTGRMYPLTGSGIDE